MNNQLTLNSQLFERDRKEEACYQILRKLRRDVEYLASKISSRAGEVNDPKNLDFRRLTAAADALLNVSDNLGIIQYRVTRNLPDHKNRKYKSYLANREVVNPYFFDFHSKDELLHSLSRFNTAVLRELRIVTGIIIPSDRLSSLIEAEIASSLAHVKDYLNCLEE